MPDHLVLPDPRQLPSRRAGGAGGGTPARQPAAHGAHLRQRLAAAVQPPRRLNRGVDPSLVFKVRAASRPPEGAFEGRGLEVLGESVDYTYFVLAEDGATSFDRAIDQYRRTGDLRSFFNVINDIEPYESDDRRGPGLEDAPPFSGVRTFDVALWPANDEREAQNRVAVVEAILASRGSEVLLRSVSARRSYLRVSASQASLNDLLETSVVELVRTPPVPFMDFRDWRNVAGHELELQAESSATVGVLDDAPAEAHPLLAGRVLSTETLSPSTYSWQPPGSHGTEVVGRLLYPGMHEELRDAAPLTAVGEVRVIRILEPDPATGGASTRFATYDFPHEIVAAAIRHLHLVHDVRVFNLSLGYAGPYNDLHVDPMTEVIDDLVRELDVVIVVPTGNAPIDLTGRTLSGHHVVGDKPNFLFAPEHRLSEPGPAALALTVGSLALSGAPAELPNRLGWQAVSAEDELSAFSRTGPGLGTTFKRMNKPDLVHYGGNLVINDTGHVVQNDPGASLVSTTSGSDPSRLFGVVNGTSFAVPAVARIAGDLTHAYPDASANLIRALVGISAVQPRPAAVLTESHQRVQAYGLGIPARDRALFSDGQRVTMTYDGSMPVDTVQIHPLPVPELFRRGSGGERSITVALAFSPPVRRQRREYLAGSMKVDLYRDIDPDELADILIRQDPDDPSELIDDRRRLGLTPGSNSFTNSTLHVRRWSARNSFVNDDETFHIVVTHKAQTWARSDPKYAEQAYALAVTLEDLHLVQADLYQLLQSQVQVPARVRVHA